MNARGLLQTISSNRRLRRWRLSLLAACALGASGCSAFRPIRGLPANYLPPELQAESREGRKAINLSLLVQTPPDQHRVEAGDILAIHIPGLLGRRTLLGVNMGAETVGEEPPITPPSNIEDPPVVGYPITVRDDHTLVLPQLPPILVRGMTIREVEEAVIDACLSHDKLKQNALEVMVSLWRPREYRVMVVRQDSSQDLASVGGQQGTVNIGSSKRGSGQVVRLRAYENDVLHALLATAPGSIGGTTGLPGLDAENAVYIIRRNTRGRACSANAGPLTPAPERPIRIPQATGARPHSSGTPVEQAPQPLPAGPQGPGGPAHDPYARPQPPLQQALPEEPPRWRDGPGEVVPRRMPTLQPAPMPNVQDPAAGVAPEAAQQPAPWTQSPPEAAFPAPPMAQPPMVPQDRAPEPMRGPYGNPQNGLPVLPQGRRVIRGQSPPNIGPWARPPASLSGHSSSSNVVDADSRSFTETPGAETRGRVEHAGYWTRSLRQLTRVTPAAHEAPAEESHDSASNPVQWGDWSADRHDLEIPANLPPAANARPFVTPAPAQALAPGAPGGHSMAPAGHSSAAIDANREIIRRLARHVPVVHAAYPPQFPTGTGPSGFAQGVVPAQGFAPGWNGTAAGPSAVHGAGTMGAGMGVAPGGGYPGTPNAPSPYLTGAPGPMAAGYGPPAGFEQHGPMTDGGETPWEESLSTEFADAEQAASPLGPDLTIDGSNVIRIPLRLGPDESLDLSEEDILLYDGDIIYIESRDTEVFYTGGLLGGGEYVLPRDRDLRVTEAISVAQSRQQTGGGGGARNQGGVSALNGDVSVSPSRVIIRRRLPDGRTTPIEIDLYEARLRPEVDIVIQPKDFIILEYTCGEASLAFLERHLLEGAIFGVATSFFTTGGSGN